MEERFRYVEHKGKTIVLVDLSNLRDEKEIIALLRKRATIPSPIFFWPILPMPTLRLRSCKRRK